MVAEKCSCRKFEELRGASVGGYISAFLEPAKDDKNRFICKVCRSIWEKRKTDDATKPILVKIKQGTDEQGK